MIVEYIRYTGPPARAEKFEVAYQRAGRVADADSYGVRWELARGAEGPEHFVVRIECDSIEGHERGFRSSPQFGEFFAAVTPFFDRIEGMKYYRVQSADLAQCLRLDQRLRQTALGVGSHRSARPWRRNS